MLLAVNGYSLNAECDGEEDGPALVFIHGLGATLETWQGQADRLNSRYRVIRYDLRCHGLSDPVDEPCSLSDLGDELTGLLDALSVERATLVGHSAGGVVAMQTALDHPDRVDALVLIGTSSECNDEAAAWYSRAADKAETGGRSAALESFGMPLDDSPGARDPSFRHLPRAVMTLNREPLTERLRGLDVPTLVIVGERDFLGVGGSVIISRAIAGSELEIVPERGHGIYKDDPEWVCARIDAFLQTRLGRTS